MPAYRKDKGKGSLTMDIEKEMEIIGRGAVDLITVEEVKKKLVAGESGRGAPCG